MSEKEPKWRRRKADRPAEIVQAALEAFAVHGFAGARLEDIARRAGVAKGSLYLYFDSKEDLFRAVVRTAVAPDFNAIRTAAQAFEGPFAQLAPMVLSRAAAAIEGTRLPAVARMVIAESRTFPDLARIWHDELVSQVMGLLAQLVAAAQDRGEVKAGEPRLIAFSLFGPMVMALLFREVFAGFESNPPDLQALAAAHGQMMLTGLLTGRQTQNEGMRTT